MKKAGKLKDKLEKELESFTGSEDEKRHLLDEIRKAAEDKSANDKKQLPLKILGNSFFGSYGAPNVFPFGSLVCAERITCTGRMCLRLMISHFNKLGYAPIVGDSFTGDTPLFIKYKEDFGFNRKGWIDIKPVSEIFNDMESQIDELGREYDYSEKPYLVLCRSGWCDCKYVYRHKTDKDVYCVTNSQGVVVDVTEDHSLYDKDYKEIKPSAITQDTELEYYTNEIHSGNEKMSTLLIEETVKSVISGKLDRFPAPFMNLSSEYSKEVIDYWNEHINDEIDFSKTLEAQLQFIYTRIK